MSRAIWKGAISFGLVNVPVVLRPASRDSALDLDWLDSRDMAPVGYQRINKRTGKTIEKEHIVKGYQYEKGEYVLLSDEDFRQANVEATQTVDIVSFVEADKIPPYYFETPYYLEPDKRGAKGYALLRETMRKTKRSALAMVVIRNRQHLAAVVVMGDALVLNTMRFAEEVLPIADLDVPKAGSKGTSVNPREIEMAVKLVDDMSEKWKPEQYRDTYHDDLMAMIKKKIAAGKTHELAVPSEHDPAPATKGAKIIDMMALLKQSLSDRGGKAAARKRPAAEPPPANGKSKAADKAEGKAEGKADTKETRKTAGKAKTEAKAKGKAKATGGTGAKADGATRSNGAKAPPRSATRKTSTPAKRIKAKAAEKSVPRKRAA